MGKEEFEIGPELSGNGEAIWGAEVIKSLKDCNGHLVGWLQGASNPVMSYASVIFSPLPVLNVEAALVLTAEKIWSESIGART